MEFLIKNASIISSSSGQPKRKKDIHIKNGIIAKIANKLQISSAKTIESPNLHVSLGWIDIGTQIGEPGYEHRETLESANAAAAAGGFTKIACFPNTKPVVDNKSSLQYLLYQTKEYSVDFLPIAALSQGANGHDITEMIDLTKNGAIAFSDGHRSVQNSGVLLRALLYSKSFDGIIIQTMNDQQLSKNGQINEGSISTQLGLQGIPTIAETTALLKDLQLANYAKANIMFHTISSKETCDIIKNARKKSKNISCTVSYKNLIFTDTDIGDFDSQLKLFPPLRENEDRVALISAIKNGTIDAICSNHVPLEEEKKKLEFSYASFGSIGLETCFAALNTHLSDELGLKVICDLLASGPRRILQLEKEEVKQGHKANLTIFDPDIEWVFDATKLHSKSRNTPFEGKQFKGRVIGIINGKRHSFN